MKSWQLNDIILMLMKATKFYKQKCYFVTYFAPDDRVAH